MKVRRDGLTFLNFSTENEKVVKLTFTYYMEMCDGNLWFQLAFVGHSLKGYPILW